MSAPGEHEDPSVVAVTELVDLDEVGPSHRPPTPAELRAALPRGWVLQDDGVTARRDLRLFFREGWILIVGLVVFGSVVAGMFLLTFPRGLAGILRLLGLIGLVLLAGGIVGPMVTRALNRGVGPKRRD